MKNGNRIVLLLVLIGTLFIVPFCDDASADSTWTFENGVLRITGNIGNCRLASSSSPYWSTSPFEIAGIYKEVQTIIVEEGVTSIGSLAFADMTNLTKVTLPSTLKEIGAEAFFSCSKLTSLTIPAGVEKLGPNVFMFCSLLKTVTFEGAAPVVSGYSYFYDYYPSSPTADLSGADIYYNSDYDWPVSRMKAMGSNCTWHDVNIVSSGTCGENATWNYSRYHVLTISGSGAITGVNSGTQTPWSAFNDEITTIIVGEGITEIPSYTFEYVTHVTEVSLPSSLTFLACNAFNDCRDLPSLTIPASVTSFGDYYYFNRCDNLAYIYYVGTESDWQTIVNYQNCTHYGETVIFVTMHEGLDPTCTEEGNEPYYAFDDTDNHEIYSLEKRRLAGIPVIKALGHDWDETIYTWNSEEGEEGEALPTLTAVRICRRDESHKETETVPSTREIFIEAGCEESGKARIQAADFENPDFEAQFLEEEIAPLGHEWYVSYVTEADRVIRYSRCRRNESHVEETIREVEFLALPAKVSKIESEAFAGTSVQAIIVPEGVESIGSLAFANCSALQYISIPANTQVAENAFYNCPDLWIDRGSVDE